MPKKSDQVTDIAARLADKQTFMKLEQPGLPWQFGMNQAFGIQIYVEYRPHPCRVSH